MAPLCAKGLVKTFQMDDGTAVKALDGASLRISPGKLTVLVGADGAGKTTLLRMICGLISPQAGRLSVLGLDSRQQAPAIQQRVGYMPQQFGLYEDLTVQENLDLYADLHGVRDPERSERCAKLLRMTDLTAFVSRPAGKLSGGMKQKLGLSCTLMRLPDLLVLDEPSVGVDPLSRLELWSLVSELVRTEHLTVLWATTYMDEAQKADEVFVMSAGRIVAGGIPGDLIGRMRALTLAVRPAAGELPRNLQAALYDRAELVSDAVPRLGQVNVLARSAQACARIQALCPGKSCTVREPEFEDFYMSVTASSERWVRTDDRQEAAAGAAPGQGGDESPVVIEVRNLVRRFGSFTAVDRTSFSVRRGEIFGLLGPNGAGKTTTFRMLCGLLPASEGELHVAGCNLRTARARARSRIGYVAQKFTLYGNLTVQQNLEFFGGAYGLAGERLRRRILESLALFRLPGQERAERLALGYKRRLAMAAALLHEPEILFLDEPTSGIDPQARREFWRLITRLSARGITTIVTTHFMEEAEYCDRIAIQDAGRMLALGTAGELQARYAGSVRDMNDVFIQAVRQARAAEAGHA